MLLRIKFLIYRSCNKFLHLNIIAVSLWWWRLIMRLGDFNNRVSHFSFNRLNWSQGILFNLLWRLTLSNQQRRMIDNHSNKKDEGYDGRCVGNSCLLPDVIFEIVPIN